MHVFSDKRLQLIEVLVALKHILMSSHKGGKTDCWTDRIVLGFERTDMIFCFRIGSHVDAMEISCMICISASS